MKFNKFSFTLFAALSVAAFSCSDDESEKVTPDTEEPTLTPEEIARKEMLEVADSTFEAITESKWKPFKFEPSADMQKDFEEGGYVSFQTVETAKYLTSIEGLLVSFKENGDTYKVEVVIPGTEDEQYQLALGLANVLYGAFGEVTELWGTLEEELAGMTRNVIAAFANDNATYEEISDVTTGLSTLVIEENDLESLSFEELLLKSKELIKGNVDKIYFNAEGQLVVEATDANFGTSKWIYTKAN